jgi:hypothetical protein
MRVFTVHTPPAENASAGEPMPLMVPERFSWAALLFGPLWLLAHKLWGPAAVLFVASAVLGFVSPWAAAGLQLVFAFEAEDVRRWALARQGWSVAGVVAAADAEAATQRLLDAAA